MYSYRYEPLVGNLPFRVIRPDGSTLVWEGSLAAVQKVVGELNKVAPTYMFVVEAGYDYAGSRILGVAATLRAARKLIGVTSRLRWRKGKGSPMWSARVYAAVAEGSYYEWVSITCMEVKGGYLQGY